MAETRVELRTIDLPEFGLPTVQPEIPAATYRDRVAALAARATAAGCAAVVVYGDREHSANLAFLTGYDPRFEEALLILVPGRRPALLIGNEGWGYAELAAGDFERVLYQSFSLPGQPRDRSPALSEILTARGLAPGMRIGAIGWKPFGPGDLGATESWLDIPAFIADALRALVGPSGAVVNLAGLMMDPGDGLRAVNDVDQLAAFEFASCHSSQGLRRVLFGVRPGMTELEAAALMGVNGLPQNAHLMLSGGRRASYGLPSPSLRRLERGDRFTMALGYQGALNARAGFLVGDAAELPAGIADYVEKLVAPYFAAAVEWYETIGIGVEGGVLYDIIERRLGDPFFGIGLNPGHLISIDEWVHSPIAKGSRTRLRSGMALQIDIIPATGTDWFTTNIEDGIALADAALRRDFAARYPEAWGRIEARRRFMGEVLGIRLKPEVLPFSNIPAYLPPFILSPGRAMAVARAAG